MNRAVPEPEPAVASTMRSLGGLGPGLGTVGVGLHRCARSAPAVEEVGVAAETGACSADVDVGAVPLGQQLDQDEVVLLGTESGHQGNGEVNEKAEAAAHCRVLMRPGHCVGRGEGCCMSSNDVPDDHLHCFGHNRRTHGI